MKYPRAAGRGRCQPARTSAALGPARSGRRTMRRIGDQRFGEHGFECRRQARHYFGRSTHAGAHAQAGEQLVQDRSEREHAGARSAGSAPRAPPVPCRLCRGARAAASGRAAKRFGKSRIRPPPGSRAWRYKRWPARCSSAACTHSGTTTPDGLLEVELSAAGAHLLESCAKSAGGNGGTNGQGRDQVLNARHSGPRIVPKIHVARTTTSLERGFRRRGPDPARGGGV